MTSAMTSCGDWLNSTPAETKVESYDLSLWFQRKTDPRSEMTQVLVPQVLVPQVLLLMMTRFCQTLRAKEGSQIKCKRLNPHHVQRRLRGYGQ